MNTPFKNSFLPWLLLLLVGYSANLSSQESGSLEQLFKDPPGTMRPYVWWHWMGPNFSKEGITKDLEAMKEAGIGGATIFNLTSAVQESHAPMQNNPWPEQTYRSPAYWEALRHAASEAQRLGLEIGLHNTVGYSTTGGPWIDEERSMQRLVWSDTTIDGSSGGTIMLRAPVLIADEGWGATGRKLSFFQDIAILAVPAGKAVVNREEVLDLTARYHPDSGLLWTPLEGSWTVYRFCHASTGRPPHPVPDDLIGKTLEADKMSAVQSEWHWNQVLEPVEEQVGAYLGRSFRHMLIDSYEAGDQNWTPGFRETFIHLKGYDPLPWLITLGKPVTGMEQDTLPRRILENEEITRRFEWDFTDVIHQLYVENGFSVGKKKLARKGLSLQFEPYGGPFSTPQGVALADLPMGEFWTYSNGGINPVIPAAARAAGKTVVGAEAFTGWPTNSMYTEDPAFLKKSADGCFASGVNRLILHHWVHQPFGDRYQPGMGMGWWGTHFGRNQTWFEPGKAFFAYLARCQVLLQQGEQVGTWLCLDQPTGYSDVISREDFLRAEIIVEGGKIRLPSGRTYPLLQFTDTLMLPAMAQKIGRLVAQGAIVAGPRPVRSPGLQDYPSCDSVVSAIAGELWPSGRSTGPAGGMVFDSLGKALEYLRQKPGMLYEPVRAPEGIAVIHRKSEEGDIFFLVNRESKARYFPAVFPVGGKQPELWQAEDGSITDATVWEQTGSLTRVELFLQAGQSIFVVFRKPVSRPNHAISFTPPDSLKDLFLTNGFGEETVVCSSSSGLAEITFPTGETRQFPLPVPSVIELSGPWEVTFEPPADTAFILIFPRLNDFRDHPEPQVTYFSGTAVYRTTFRMDPGFLTRQERIMLDPGSLNDIAEVTVNGTPTGVVWYPPWRVEITSAVQPGENRLEIAVTTNWANRMIGDEQEPADFLWGTDRGPDFGRPMAAWPDWFIRQEARPSTGRKSFSNWYY
ncbi:MAG: hypothetical protein JXA23_10200, partial [Bacteroidales bacterium]|nr:hypothetical protein [Bacteroidales bacterium]